MIRVAGQRPVSVDPVAMQDLGGYGITSQSFEFLCTADPKDRVDIAPGPGPEVDARTPTAPVWTFDLRQGVKWHDGTAVHRGRRRRDDGAPRHGRQLGPQGRPRAGRRGRHRREHGRPSRSLGANGNFPYLVSVFNAQTLITPKAYAAGHDARQGPGRDRAPGSSKTYNPQTGATFERNPDWWGGKTPLDGTRVHLLRRHRPDGHRLPGRPGRRASSSSTSCPASRCSTTRTSTSSTRRRRSIARSGCARDTGQFADKQVRQALALHVRPAGAHPAAVPGQGPARQRPRHLAGLPVLRLDRSRSGPRTSPRPSRSCPTPA